MLVKESCNVFPSDMGFLDLATELVHWAPMTALHTMYLKLVTKMIKSGDGTGMDLENQNRLYADIQSLNTMKRKFKEQYEAVTYLFRV